MKHGNQSVADTMQNTQHTPGNSMQVRNVHIGQNEVWQSVRMGMVCNELGPDATK